MISQAITTVEAYVAAFGARDMERERTPSASPAPTSVNPSPPLPPDDGVSPT
ncbi:hypothetical protein ABZ027_25810 [Streptomyces sp. NPDC006332]|uniref:hypothetical protein n=1 Tax=Streptomyces sp. NPDC006332 TaxID=3155456 RepID=UPI0033BA14D2